MITVDVNPADAETLYLAGATRCFSDWGGTRMFQWVAHRKVGGPEADVMILHDGTESLAGSTVTYRSVVLRGSHEVLVGIMTGSWTLPEARGQGCFSRVVQESQRLATLRGAALLLAFVTEDNASARRLTAAGASTFPTWYCSAEPTMAGPRAPRRPLPVDGHADPELLRRAGLGSVDDTVFAYPDMETWTSQFLARPGPVEVLPLGDGWAIRERTDHSDRIHLLSLRSASEQLAALMADARASGRQLFAFTAQAAVKDAARAVGMSCRPGYLTAVVADATALATALGIATERVPDGALTDPTSPWFLGTWMVHGGDRM